MKLRVRGKKEKVQHVWRLIAFLPFSKHMLQQLFFKKKACVKLGTPGFFFFLALTISGQVKRE